MSPVSIIGDALFVDRGAAVIFTKEIQRIDEFRADR